jgi:hypothetical protein
MFKNPKKLGLFVMVATLVLVVAPKVFAAPGDDTLFGLNITDFLFSFIANFFSDIVFQIASWLLGVTGILLNVGMYFTTHLGIFIDSTPVIYKVWTIIRDISSLFLIFFILWASIQMILGLQNPKFGQLIKNIVVVGILINFSFFFTRILIDVSNIVSLEFYNAIAPTNSASLNCREGENNPCANIGEVTKAMSTNGGISNLFMNSLKITAWYDANGKLTRDSQNKLANETDSMQAFKIIIITFFGALIMLLASASFLVVAGATIMRLAVLIMLLAFSPIWIASIAIPHLKDFSKRWTDQLKTQLIFLPVYLGLMYVAIRIMTESNLNTIMTSSPGGLGDIVNMVVGFSIILIMMNLPIVAAASVAGISKGWTEKVFGNMTSWGKGVLKAGPAAAARQTIGASASAIDKKLSNTRIPLIGNSVTGRDVRGATVGALAKSKFGGSTSYEDLQKTKKEVGKKDKEIGRTRAFNAAYSAYNSTSSTANLSTLKTAFGDLNDKEKMGLGVKVLTNAELIKNMKKSEFDAIKKSDDMSDEDKAAISKARTDVLNSTVTSDPTGDQAKNMIRNMEGSDLMKLYEKNSAIFKQTGLVNNLTTSQLKYLNENGFDDPTLKHDVYNIIVNKVGAAPAIGGGKKHQAASWISNPNNNWL